MKVPCYRGSAWGSLWGTPARGAAAAGTPSAVPPRNLLNFDGISGFLLNGLWVLKAGSGGLSAALTSDISNFYKLASLGPPVNTLLYAAAMPLDTRITARLRASITARLRALSAAS